MASLLALGAALLSLMILVPGSGARADAGRDHGRNGSHHRGWSANGSHHRGWSPNGCPAATPPQAGAATPGAPTAVHAIAGDGSATVTWRAPTTGQADVVSYTLTASKRPDVHRERAE